MFREERGGLMITYSALSTVFLPDDFINTSSIAVAVGKFKIKTLLGDEDFDSGILSLVVEQVFRKIFRHPLRGSILRIVNTERGVVLLDQIQDRLYTFFCLP